MRKKLLYTGGLMSLLFGIIHILFWDVNNWSEELAVLSPDNRAIMQMLNVVTIYFFFFGTVISFFLARAKQFVFSDKAIILFFVGVYILRIAFGYPLFGFSAVEVSVWAACGLTAVLYLLSLREPHKAIV